MSDTLTVAGWLDQYLDNLTGIQESTAYNYRRTVAGLPVWMSGMPLTDLGRGDIGLWIRQMEADSSAAGTIRNRQRLLSSALTAAVRAGLIPTNPALGHKLPRRAPARPRAQMFLTPDQFETLTAAFTEHWHPFLRFLVASGCRWGEATALTPADVHRHTGQVEIMKAWTYLPGVGYRVGPTKTRASERIISVSPWMLEELDYSHKFMFTTRRGNPLRIHNFHTRVWTPAVARADLGFRPRIHDLRHTCASWLINAGCSMRDVQEHLGHGSVTTTMDVYAHVSRAQLRRNAEVISDILRGV